MKITKDTLIGEAIKDKGDMAAELLMNAGMGCVGCPMAQMESIEDGCKSHGFNDPEIQELVEALNK